MHIERLGFVAFPVADLNRSRDFYSRVLALPVIDHQPDHIDFDFAGTTLRAYLHHGEYRRQHSGLQFFVANVDAAHRELLSAKVNLRSGVRDEPWGGRVFTIADPD